MLPSFTKRGKAGVSARKETVDIVARQRLNTAPHHHVPHASNAQLKNRDAVLMFRENQLQNGLYPMS